jgi:hypothetical protein
MDLAIFGSCTTEIALTKLKRRNESVGGLTAMVAAAVSTSTPPFRGRRVLYPFLLTLAHQGPE